MTKLAETKNRTPVDTGRRRLIAGAMGVGAVAGLGLANITAQAAPAADKKPEAKSTGYHETEHIRRYYRSARDI